MFVGDGGSEGFLGEVDVSFCGILGREFFFKV